MSSFAAWPSAKKHPGAIFSKIAVVLFCVLAVRVAEAKRPSSHTPLFEHGASAAGIRAGSPAISTITAVEGRSVIEAEFKEAGERVYFDIPLAPIPKDATSVEVRYSISRPELIRAAALYLQAGGGWHVLEISPPDGANTTVLSFAPAFAIAEGRPSSWHRSEALRVSLWGAAPGEFRLALGAVAARRDTLAIVKSGSSTAPGEEAFAERMAKRMARLLDRNGLPYAVVSDRFDRSSIRGFDVLALPWCPSLGSGDLAQLKRYVGEGGKLIVFYNGNAELAALLDMDLRPWREAPAGAEWTGWRVGDEMRGAVAEVPHRTTNIIEPRPADAETESSVLGTWRENGGAGGLAACLATGKGAWFAHIPPLAGRAAADFMLLVVGRFIPELARRSLSDSAPVTLPAASAGGAQADLSRLITERNRKETLKARLVLSGSRPEEGEIRALWELGRDMRRTRLGGYFSELAGLGVNTVFYHLQSGALQHARCGGRLPLSKRAEAALAPRLSDLATAARESGVALHAWVICWAAEEMSAGERSRLAAEGRMMQAPDGGELAWLTPAHPANREVVERGILDLVEGGVAGVHLDYARFPEEGCYSPVTRAAFEDDLGREVASWPSDALPFGVDAEAFAEFRRKLMSEFVESVAAAARRVNSDVVVSAAVFPSPTGSRRLGQDARRWLESGAVDFVAPMIYTESGSRFSAGIAANLDATGDLGGRVVAGIGSAADESQLSPLGIAEQVVRARRAGLRGFAFYAADNELLACLARLRLAGEEK